jgi:hypothetical protein
LACEKIEYFTNRNRSSGKLSSIAFPAGTLSVSDRGLTCLCTIHWL